MASTLKWYRTLRPRVLIDLVSDYAGKELFLVEGDSLLLECFSDTRIDFDDGFQLLHAVYVVESLLENMVRRNCNFHIAFFESHRNLCFPPTAKLVNGPKYLLARSVIFQHLERHVQQSHPGIQIHSFASLQDQDFSAYLDRTSLYFVMCHDGARHRSTKKWRAKGNVAPSINDDRSKKIVFRGMMHYFIRRGLNVALIHSLERRDTKLLATIVEGWHRDLVDAITAEIEYLEALSSLIQRDNGKQSQPKKSARSKANYEMEELATNHISSLKERSQQPPSFQQVAQALEFLRPKWSERMFVTVAAVTRSLIDYREPTAASTTISKPSAGTTTTAVAAARSTATVLLLQALVLDHVPLSDRRFLELHISGPNLGLVQRFVMTFVCEAHLVLIDENWTLAAKQEQMQNILADLFDGRLFWVIAYLLQEHKSKQFDSFHTDINRLIASVSSLCNVDLPRLCKIPGLSINAVKSSPDDRKIGKDDFVLPFSSSVFDKHLSCIQTVDDEHGDSSTCMSAKILREVSFWHNARKSTQPKRARFSRPPEQEARFLRSNQRYMAEMNAYAASLTGALGKALTPETIAVQSKQKPTSQTKKQKHEGQKATPVGVATPINPEKKDQDKERALRAWAAFRKDHLDNDSDQMARVKRLTKYFAGLPASKARDVQEEVELYKIQSLLVVWRRTKNLSIAAQMWSTIQSVANVPRGLSHVVVDALKSTIMALKLPDLRIDPTRDLRALTFRFEIPSLDPTELELRLPPQNFELLHAGPYMDRNMGSRPDARVRFAPDAWQRQVLDELDARHSVFVVAPTSAGKTFISFYAMEKVLRESDDGVLVYVAPTKALVNQVAAEIQARFRKTFKHPHGRSVWALHTRDYVINNPLTCQILVTVPQILQIMLLSPSNSRSWSPKLRTIVIDEIHAIGQEDGLIYEQLLLMAPCPIIALSATVGNPESFNDWLHSTQKAAGFDLTLISHPHRWSDLRKFTFAPPKVFYFDGLPSKSSYEALGLDGVSGFDFLHPVASLIDRSRGIPDDLNLEARDCFTLYQALVKHQRQDFPITEDLDPHRFFHLSPITKAQVITWEDRLKEILREWMVNVASPFEQVLEELRTTASNEVEDLLISKDRDNYAVSQDSREVDADDPRSTTLPMLLKMHEADALPALLFNYDRSQCEKIAKAILEELETSEAKWKCESRKWKKTIRDWEEWKAAHASKKIQKASKSANVKQRARKEDGNAESVSKLDTIIEAASQAIDPFANFNPNDAVEDFSFARKSHGPVSEVEAGFQKLRWAGVSEWLINCFSRGVGVHHAGLNKRYRQMVEVWFRKGFLRVVIATGTLSLGINAPARTVVFSSDSIFLTALNFRQSAGRAGRRGFDLLGNVVFQNVSMSKACRLLSSRLPDLNGHFPITTSLVLRLFILLKESQEAPFAVKMVDSLLSQPRMYMGGSSFREQVLHHLRFSIE
ncbi:MAG: hypothetical protein M1833_002687 [Piccolia ochrophora]|nr:MAG: hypothetical protein M1833_002687 [Piccolia ochrophora]